MSEFVYTKVIGENGQVGVIVENSDLKLFRSKDYNFQFDKRTGFFARWGKTKEENPQYSPFGCEIADVEVTTRCEGVGIGGKKSTCAFCYKSNTPNGLNMSFETFKELFDKLPKTTLQIAFGADASATSNPDLFRMMDYCRDNGVIPNITVAQITPETADQLVSHCGAVAVSVYDNKDICYDSVKLLTDRGLKQVNIHAMVSLQSFDRVMQTLNDSLTDPRLANLNAIVLLSLKKKGRGIGYTRLPDDKFKELIDFAFKNNITIGFDLCGTNKVIEATRDCSQEIKNILDSCAEPCEAMCMSSYFGVNAKLYPCSFCDEDKEWVDGIDVLSCDDFVKDIWFNHFFEDL